jgi:hypothetical protein
MHTNLTAYSERKIEQVEQRLAGIEKTLSNLTVLTKTLSSSGTPGQVSVTIPSPSYAPPSIRSNTAYATPSVDEKIDGTFEGNSSHDSPYSVC